jgi:serine phosphatase RsbU (regulator of sigma subunit)
MSLLVVDGPSDFAAMISDVLASSDFDAVSTTSVQLAREFCEHTQPEMIICGEFSDASVLSGEFGYIPVVVVSQTLDTEVLLAALQAGLADVWSLPMDVADLNERARLGIDRARLRASRTETRLQQHIVDLQRDQRAGRYIQMGMLPPNPMAIDRVRLHHRIMPSLILSGDFVDYFRVTDDHFAFYVADVSGHGASSAFVTVLLKNFSRRLRREYRPSMLEHPGEILEWINRELLDQNMDKHVALFLAVGHLKKQTITYVNAGHFPPPVLVPHPQTSKPARLLELNGKPLGLFEEVSYKQDTVDLNEGDRLVIFSDGVLELMNDADLATKESRLVSAARDNIEIDDLWTALDLNSSRASPDDVTCLTVTRQG